MTNCNDHSQTDIEWIVLACLVRTKLSLPLCLHRQNRKHITQVEKDIVFSGLNFPKNSIVRCYVDAGNRAFLIQISSIGQQIYLITNLDFRYICFTILMNFMKIDKASTEYFGKITVENWSFSNMSSKMPPSVHMISVFFFFKMLLMCDEQKKEKQIYRLTELNPFRNANNLRHIHPLEITISIEFELEMTISIENAHFNYIKL